MFGPGDVDRYFEVKDECSSGEDTFALEILEDREVERIWCSRDDEPERMGAHPGERNDLNSFRDQLVVISVKTLEISCFLAAKR